MYHFLSLLFFLLIGLGGVVLIYGALKSWPMLVDPPENMAYYYSQALIKKLFGKKFLLIETYVLGILFILVGFFWVWEWTKGFS